MEFKVFNRYGQLVFETNNQSEGWDGTFNDTELNPGTFVYTLEITFAEGLRELYTGDVTLVR
jgi:gliding motility-associated-like protein